LTEEREFMKGKLEEAQKRLEALEAESSTPAIEIKRAN
jgi:hypothetical protein